MGEGRPPFLSLSPLFFLYLALQVFAKFHGGRRPGGGGRGWGRSTGWGSASARWRAALGAPRRPMAVNQSLKPPGGSVRARAPRAPPALRRRRRVPPQPCAVNAPALCPGWWLFQPSHLGWGPGCGRVCVGVAGGVEGTIRPNAVTLHTRRDHAPRPAPLQVRKESGRPRTGRRSPPPAPARARAAADLAARRAGGQPSHVPNAHFSNKNPPSNPQARVPASVPKPRPQPRRRPPCPLPPPPCAALKRKPSSPTSARSCTG